MEVLYKSLNSIIENQIIMAEINGENVAFHYIVEADTEKRKQWLLDFDKNNFYLSNDGFVIMYQKYALGSGASGIFSFTVPYTDIVHILHSDIISALSLP